MQAKLFPHRPSCFAILVLASVCLLPAPGHADPSDPFDPSNRATIISPRTRLLMEVIQLDAKLSTERAKPGEVVRLTITGKPRAGYHAYPLTQRTDLQPASMLPLIQYTGSAPLKPLWPTQESTPQFAYAPGPDIVLLEHEKPFTWTQEFLVDPKAEPGKQELTVQINLQVCNEKECRGPDLYRPLTVAFEIVPGEVITPVLAVTERLQGPPPARVVTPSAEVVAGLTPKGKNTEVSPGDKKKTDTGTVDRNNLWSFLWFASASAFLMLLTPCVFPMIPITVNFFLKQSEREHHKPLAMASVYSGTIVILLTLIMLVLGKFVIDLANNAWFNLALGAVLVLFALSLFGMYELELPHFLARYTSAREGQGGLVGAMFMAMTFTITSFTCTGPFLGLMLGSVAGVQPPLINLILGALVYSATFAAPFFLLALFPGLLKKLPKSGSWLNSVKVTMGFLELGAALKFLSNTDLAFNPGNAQIFNYDTVLSAWIILSVACGLYLLGFFRLPHDDKVESIGVVRMMLGIGFLGLAIYLAPAMLGHQPAGIIGDNVVAFLPIRTGHANDPGTAQNTGTQGHKDWYLDYEDAWKDAVNNDKLIFIDFTGGNCSNCRLNERTVFPLPQVQEEMKKFVKVSLYTDVVPNPRLSSAAAKQQAERNRGWQDVIGKPSLPYYVILQPDHTTAAEDGKLKGTVLGTTDGAIFDVQGFIRLLQSAQSKRIAQLQQPLE